MKSQTQSHHHHHHHQQNGSSSSNSNIQQINPNGEQQLLQYNVSNYISLLMQQKINTQANQPTPIHNLQSISSTSQPALISIDKHYPIQLSQNLLTQQSNSLNSQPYLLQQQNSQQQSQQQQQQSQQQSQNSSNKGLESNDINYLLKAYQEREKQIKAFRHLRKEYRLFENFKSKEFQTFYLNGYDAYSSCMREEKQRIISEEGTIKKYFNIKADQLNLKIVVFNLINSILQTNQGSYNELIEQGHDYEANELLKQTNKFKEEIHKFIYKNQFRLTSVIIYICNFSRQRFLVEQERVDLLIRRHEDVYKDAIKQRHIAQQALLKHQHQDKMQKLQKNIQTAFTNYKTTNSSTERNNTSNTVYHSVIGLQTNLTKINRLQSAQSHSTNQNIISNCGSHTNNYLQYQEFQSDGCLDSHHDEEDDLNNSIEDVQDLFHITEQEEDDSLQKKSPNKLKRSFSIQPNRFILSAGSNRNRTNNGKGVIYEHEQGAANANTNVNTNANGGSRTIYTAAITNDKEDISSLKKLRLKAQISSAKKTSEIKQGRGGVVLNQFINQENIQSIHKIQNNGYQTVLSPKSLLCQQQHQQQPFFQSQQYKTNLNNGSSSSVNILGVPSNRGNYINITNNHNNNTIASQTIPYTNQQIAGPTIYNGSSGIWVNSSNLSSNINQGYPSLGPAATLSIKLSIMKNEKQRKLLKKVINEYNVSDIASRVRFKKFKPKKSAQQNQISGNSVEETFYHLAMHGDLLYSSSEVSETKVNIDRLIQQMLKQNSAIKSTINQFCSQTKTYQSRVTKTFQSRLIEYHNQKCPTQSSKTCFSSQTIQKYYSNYLIAESSAVNQLSSSSQSQSQAYSLVKQNYMPKDQLILSPFLNTNLIQQSKCKWVNQQFLQLNAKEFHILSSASSNYSHTSASQNTLSSNIDNKRYILHSNSSESLSIKGLYQPPSQRNLIIRSSNLRQCSSQSKECSSPSQSSSSSSNLNRRYFNDQQQQQRQQEQVYCQINSKGSDSSSLCSTTLNLIQNSQGNSIPSTRQQTQHESSTTPIHSSIYTDSSQRIYNLNKQDSASQISKKIQSQLAQAIPLLLPSNSSKQKKVKSLKDTSKTNCIYQIQEKTCATKCKPSSKNSKKSKVSSATQQQSKQRLSQNNNQSANGVVSTSQSTNLLTKRNSSSKQSNHIQLVTTNSTQQLISLSKQAFQNASKRQNSNKQSLDNSFENHSSPHSNLNSVVSNSGLMNQNNFKIKHINLNVQQNQIQELIKKNVVLMRLSKHNKSQLLTTENQDQSSLKTDKSAIENETEALQTLRSYKSSNFIQQNDLSLHQNTYETMDYNKDQILPTPKGPKKQKIRPSSNIDRNQKQQTKQKVYGKQKNRQQQSYLESDFSLLQQQQD